jgi:beta-glucosidase
MTVKKNVSWCIYKVWPTAAVSVTIALLSLVSVAVQSKELNANYFYFFDGKPIGGWGLTLGDEANWVLPVNGDVMVSAGKQIEFSRADYKGSGDAIHLKWSRAKGKGQFAIYGSPINLIQLENRAALTMEIKIIKKPKASVSIGMDCGYPCRGEVNIHKMLREMKTDEWIMFPIPINCFAVKGADLSKVNSPILIASEGQFELQIANIRLELLPEGAPTCAT